MSGSTRREALLATAAGAAVAAARAAPAGAASAAPALTGDAAVLAALHRTEMFALEAYVLTARSGPAQVHDLVVPLRNHEAKHVAALATALEALGAPRFPPPRGAAALDREARRLGIAPTYSARRGARDLLAFHAAVEATLLGAWAGAHRSLRETSLLRLAGGVLASQAQHLVVLRAALGRDELPAALDAGRT